MKAGKSILFVAIALFASLPGYSQNHDESPAPADRFGDLARQVQLYPNPAIETLNIKFESPCAKRIKLTLHNIIGNAVEVETETIDEHELQVKVRDLPTGYYLLSLRDPDTNFKSTYKFLKR